MTTVRRWFREHTLGGDCAIAAAFFALGLLSVRIAYDVGAAQRHNFRFAVGVAFMALLTLPLAGAGAAPRSA